MGSDTSVDSSFKTLEELAKALDGLSGAADLAGFVYQVDRPEDDHLQVVLHGSDVNMFFIFEVGGQARRYTVKNECMSGPVKVLASWDEAAMEIVNRLKKHLRENVETGQLALDMLAMLERRLTSHDISIMDICNLA